jgi:hypothetical protein
MKKVLFVVIIHLLLATNAFSATVPNTFSNGTTANASEVNENFTALANAITALENLLASATPFSDLTGATYCGVHMFNHVGVFTNGGSTSAGNGFDSIIFANSTQGSWSSSASDFFRWPSVKTMIIPWLQTSALSRNQRQFRLPILLQITN